MATTPTFNRLTNKNTKKFVKAHRMYISDVNLTTAAGTYDTFVRVDPTKDSTIDQAVEEYTEIDDSGQVVVWDETITGVTVSGMFLPRDDKIRKIFRGQSTTTVKDKVFCVVYVGAKLQASSGGTTVYEVWVFPRVKFSQDFSYQIGGEGKYPYKFIAVKNDSNATFTVPLPSGMTGVGGWDLTTTGTVSVEADEFYYTADIA